MGDMAETMAGAVGVDGTGEIGQDAVDVEKPVEDDLQMWSVTTLIGALDKPALLYWAAEQTALAAIQNEATWKGMLQDRGQEEAVKWLRDARFRQPRNILSAANLGTVTHTVCETYALTGTKPSKQFVQDLIFRAGGDRIDMDGELWVVGTMLNKFDGWLQRFSPSYQATEVCVYSPTYGYAGQCDAFMTIDGVRFIVDYKNTRNPFDSKGKLKTPYPEQVGLQLAAYRYAEMAAIWRPRRFEQFRRRYYLLSPTERELAVKVPEVDSGLVIQLSPESCDAYPIDCGQEAHTAFLYAMECFRWVQETSKTIMGVPLEPPTDHDG